MCLAAGFYPNEGDMVLTGSKTDNQNLNKAVLSSSGKYFYAGYSKETIKECRVNDVVVPDKKDTGNSSLFSGHTAPWWTRLVECL